MRGMLDGAKDDGDGEEGVLVNDDLCDRGRERAGTKAIQEDVFCEVHILMDTPPFTSLVGPSMMVAPRTRGIIQGEIVSHAVVRVFSRSPGSLGYIPFPAKLAL